MTLNRATSAYTLHINTADRTQNLSVLDAAVAALPDGVLVTDQHLAGDYVSVSYRTTDDEAAQQIAVHVLTQVWETYPTNGGDLTTGLGFHRRDVATFTAEVQEPDLGMCEWFALCDRPATQTITHPILGEVPACDRCAEKAAR